MSMKVTESKFMILLGEFNIQKCKLESKNEAIQILSKELEQCKSERDQFKLMASQLRDRYSALKRRVEGWGPSLMGVYDVQGLKGQQQQSLALMLCELKEKNKLLQTEVDEFKLKLQDAQGDIRLLRNQRSREGSLAEEPLTLCLATPEHRLEMVSQLESIKSKYVLLERDLQSLLDEKEELITARDAYKHKVERLNQRLNVALRGDDECRVLDIDAILMENRYLQECQKQLEEEITMLKTSISKYKTLMEKKKFSRSNLRINTASGNYFLSNKQVQQILQTNPLLELPNNPSSAADLRSLVVALFETLSDKTLALSHQRKTNKILGNRITELERKLKSKDVLLNCKAEPTSLADVESTSLNKTPNPDKIEELEQDLDLLPTREKIGRDSRTASVSSFRSSLSDCETPSLSSSTTPALTESPFHSSQPNMSEIPSGTSENDDLPPQLQKLLAIALMDLDKLEKTSQSEEAEKEC